MTKNYIYLYVCEGVGVCVVPLINQLNAHYFTPVTNSYIPLCSPLLLLFLCFPVYLVLCLPSIKLSLFMLLWPFGPYFRGYFAQANVCRWLLGKVYSVWKVLEILNLLKTDWLFP